MTNFLAGCGFITICTVVIIVIAVVVGTQCGGSDDGAQPGTPSPTPTPPPLINASDLYYEYQRNETRANAYKGRWLTVELSQIHRIDDGGKVLMNMDASGWQQIQLDFKNDSDVIPLNPGERVVAVCKLSGLTWDTLLVFKDCRFP